MVSWWSRDGSLGQWEMLRKTGKVDSINRQETQEGIRRSVETGITNEVGKLRVKPTGKQANILSDLILYNSLPQRVILPSQVSTILSRVPSIKIKLNMNTDRDVFLVHTPCSLHMQQTDAQSCWWDRHRAGYPGTKMKKPSLPYNPFTVPEDSQARQQSVVAMLQVLC